MFKKAFKVSSKNNLSGKDRKKLVTELSKYYDPESVSMLLEKNNPTVIVNKVQGSKIVLYLIDDIPVLVDESGKGDLFPTSNKRIINVLIISLYNSTISKVCRSCRN